MAAESDKQNLSVQAYINLPKSSGIRPPALFIFRFSAPEAILNLPLNHVISPTIMSGKANILLIGSGGVGTLAAYNLEAGGLASVTSVLRSNHDAVAQKGFTIASLDHGFVEGWRPSIS